VSENDEVTVSGLRHAVFRCAALLLFLALLTGGIASFGLSGDTDVFDARTLLSAHTAGLISVCLLFGFGATLPHLRYAPRQLRYIVILFVVAQFANWIITSAKSFLFVHGISPGGASANHAVFVALTIFVVGPALISAFLWMIGFSRAVPPAQ
jgi:hypothetical protein